MARKRKNKSKKKQEKLEKRLNAFAKDLFRKLEEHSAFLSRRRRRGTLKHVKTRSTYAWRQRNEKSQTITVARPLPCIGEVPRNCVGEPSSFDIAPVFREKNSTVWLLFMKRPRGKKLYPFKEQHEWKRCCYGTDSGQRYCERGTCVNCFAKINNPTEGFEWYIKSEYMPERAKIVDPAGVSPRGTRPKGSKQAVGDDLGPYKLTSNIVKYKGQQQDQIDPKERKRK